MTEITIKPKGKVAENKEVVNKEVSLNKKFLYSCKPSDLLALRSWAHTQEELFSVDPDINRRVDVLIKTIDQILNQNIFGGK